MKGILSKKRANEIINSFPRARILVVGDIMADHFIWGTVSRISPEAPVPVVSVEKEMLLLGGSANVAHNISAMGGRVSLAGVIGKDDEGERLREVLQAKQIDLGGVVMESSRPTTIKTRILAHGQQVVRFDRETRDGISLESIEKILASITKRVEHLDAIVISDYDKGVVTEPLLSGIRQHVAGKGITVCVDPKHHDFSLYRGFDVVTPNHHEAERVLGIENINGGAIVGVDEILRNAVAELLVRHDLKALLITRGDKGMSLFEREAGCRHTRYAAEAREVFDVTGAGDTVIGVFALAVAAGASFQEAASLANGAAGIVVGKAGTATVSRQELKKVL